MVATKDFFTPPDARVFFQVGPTRPGASYEYLGTGEAMAATINLGKRTVIRTQSREQRGKWDVVGTKYGVPDLHATGIHMYMPRAVASFLEDQAKTGCVISMQIVLGKCNKPDEFHVGWESKLLYEYAQLEDIKIPEMPSVDGSKLDPIYVDGSMTFQYFDRIQSIRFAEKAGVQVLAEVVDAVYAGQVSCGDCGPYSDGNDHLYALADANAGSPGLSGQLIYTIDGNNFTAVDIPTLGGLSPNKIRASGDFLIVISEAKRNLQYARRTDAILASDWASVTTGFVAAHGPRGIYVKSPGEVFFAGAVGYLYKATDYQSKVSVIEAATLSSNNYNEIHGDGGEVVVAVGDSNLVVVSTNSGQTFTLLTGPLNGSDLQAIAVLDANNWIVGGDGGAFYRTNDGGATWTAIPFSLSGVGAIIHDVKFTPQSKTVGYMAVEVGARGYVYRTTDGGTHWFKDDPSIRGMTANLRLDFVAPSSHSINVCATGGLAIGGTDGFLSVGS
jgi:hypothetical protein